MENMKPRKKRTKGPEAQLQATIREYLRAKRCLPVRINSGGVVAAYQGRERFIRFNDQPGVSDLLVCCPPDGRFVAIEGKSPNGKLTETQEDFLQRVEAAGGIAVVARSLEDVEKVIT